MKGVPDRVHKLVTSEVKVPEIQNDDGLKSLKDIPPDNQVAQRRGVKIGGSDLRSLVGQHPEIAKAKDKATAIADLLETLVVLGPPFALFLVLDYTGKRSFRRVAFPKILKEVAASTDKAVREEKLKKDLARKAITDPAAALHTTYGRFWRRVGAYVLDVSLFLAVAAILVSGILIMPVLGSWLDHSQYGWLIVLLPFVCDWLYTAFMLSSSKQATLGMKAMGLLVTDQYAERLRFGGATAWHFATLLSYVTLGLGFLIQIWTRRHQALHDLIGKTAILSQPEQKKVPWWMILLCCVLAVPLFVIGLLVLVFAEFVL